YGMLRDLGERAGGWLLTRGVEPGDRVCIQLDNGLELLAAHLGCMSIGAVRVPLNAHYRAAEIRPILEDAAPKLVIARDASLYDRPIESRIEIAFSKQRLPRVDWPAPTDDVT